MKKKLITIVMGMVFWAGLFGGCGQTEVKQDNAITNSSEEGKEEGTAEEKELTGTIDEIKDFMFVVTDDQGASYAFTFILRIVLLLKKNRRDWKMSAMEIL